MAALSVDSVRYITEDSYNKTLCGHGRSQSVSSSPQSSRGAIRESRKLLRPSAGFPDHKRSLKDALDLVVRSVARSRSPWTSIGKEASPPARNSCTPTPANRRTYVQETPTRVRQRPEPANSSRSPPQYRMPYRQRPYRHNGRQRQASPPPPAFNLDRDFPTLPAAAKMASSGPQTTPAIADGNGPRALVLPAATAKALAPKPGVVERGT
jgi:hypothetical protein